MVITFDKVHGRSAADLYDFLHHIDGTAFRQNATTIDSTHILTNLGNAHTVQDALDYINSIGLGGGGGASSVGGLGQIDIADGYGGWLSATNVQGGAGFLSIGATSVASTGTLRLSNNPATIIAQRDPSDTTDLVALYATSTDLAIGGISTEANSHTVSSVFAFRKIEIATGADLIGTDFGAGLFTYSDNSSVARGIYIYPNLVVGPLVPFRTAGSSISNFVRQGEGFISMYKRTVAPIANPSTDWIDFWVEPTIHHPMWMLSDGTTFDLASVILDQGTPQNIRGNRSSSQSPIDNSKNGIVNLGSRTSAGASTGVTGNYATNIGGDNNEATGDYATVGGEACKANAPGAVAFGHACQVTGSYGCTPGGFINKANGYASFAVNEGCISAGDLGFTHGEGGTSSRTAQYVHACSTGAPAAIAQFSRMILRGVSISGSTINLSDDFNGTELDLNNLVDGRATHYSLAIRVVMGDRSGTSGKAASFYHEVLANWTGAALEILFDTPIISDTTGAHGNAWGITISAVAPSTLRIAAHGDAGTLSVDCVAVIEWAEVAGGI